MYPITTLQVDRLGWSSIQSKLANFKNAIIIVIKLSKIQNEVNLNPLFL